MLFSLSYFILLKDYREEHPEVTILDPPNAIQHLYNRQSMLQEVADLNLSNGYGNICDISVGNLAFIVNTRASGFTLIH
jgi:hypothetical protein